MLTISVVWRLSARLGLVDHPSPRKVHTTPIPRVGGWGITVGMLVPILLTVEPDPLLYSFVAGAFTLFLFGVWDDVAELDHWRKFAGQLAAVAIVVYYGGLYVSRLPFFDTALDPAVGKAFTVFALVGAINAVNHSDGLDGLAGGVSMLSLIAIAVLGYLVRDGIVVGVALAAIGGILGFLRYNSYPARIFMGDSGSQVLGFTLGFLVVYLTQVAHTALSAALPALLLGLPIADILVVLVQRMRRGVNWFKASRNHVHHRLLDLGFDHSESVVIIYSVQAVSVVTATLVRYQSDWTVAAIYLGLVGGLFAALIQAERRGARLLRGARGRSLLSVVLTRMANSAALRRAPLVIVSAVVPAFMLAGTVWAARVPEDFSVVAAVLAAVVGLELLRTHGAGSGIVRAAIYVTVVFSAYLVTHYPGPARSSAQAVTAGAVLMLALAIGAYVRLAKSEEFGTTPTDYLIVFGALALTVFGSIDMSSRSIAELVVYAIVLLYGCEILYGCIARRWGTLQLATLATLGVIALRGVV